MDRSLIFKCGHRQIGWLSSITALGIGIFAAAVETGFSAPPGDTPSFIALQLKVTTNQVTLMQAQKFPGAVKPEPQAPGLDYVLRAKDGAVVGKGAIENPRFQHSCAEEVPGSGNLKQVTSTTDESITVLRFATGLNVDSVEFFETPRAGAKPNSTRKSLGKISLKTP